MLVEVRVYESFHLLRSGASPIRRFVVEDTIKQDRVKLAKTAWWAMRNGHALVTTGKTDE